MVFNILEIAEKYGVVLKGTLYGCLKPHECNGREEEKYTLNDVLSILDGTQEEKLERITVYRRPLFRKPNL